MKNKSNAGAVVAVILLGIATALCIAAAVLIAATQRVGKLHPKTEADIATAVDDAGASEVEEQTKDLADFSANLSGENTADTAEEEAQAAEAEAAAEAEEAAAAEDTASEYLCDYSNSREITADDFAEIASRTADIEMPAGKSLAQMIINEMYARYGYHFSTGEIQEYFEQKSWYQEITDTTDDMDGIYRQMSDIEKANIDFLKEQDA